MGVSSPKFCAKVIKKEDIWLFLYFCTADNTNDDEKICLIIDFVFIGFQCNGGWDMDGALRAEYAFEWQ